MPCFRCFACRGKVVGLSRGGMEGIVGTGVTVRQIAKRDPVAVGVLSGEPEDVREACYVEAEQLIAQFGRTPLFHARYVQDLAPRSGVPAIDAHWKDNYPPLRSVFFIYEEEYRVDNSDHIISNLLMGFLRNETDGDPSRYQGLSGVPMEKAIVIHSTDNGGAEHLAHDNIISLKLIMEEGTGIVTPESLDDAMATLEWEKEVKLVIIDKLEPILNDKNSPPSYQWMKVLEETLGHNRHYVVVMIVDKSDFSHASQQQIINRMKTGVNGICDTFHAYKNGSGEWNCTRCRVYS